MASKVYWADLRADFRENLQQKLTRLMKTAGMGVGAAALGYGKGIASSITGSKSTLGKIGSTLANAATGGMYGGALGAAKGVGSLIKNGFKTMGNHFSGKSLNKD